MSRLFVSIIGIAMTFILQLNISSAQESFIIADGASMPVPVVSIAQPEPLKQPVIPSKEKSWNSPEWKEYYSLKGSYDEAQSVILEIKQADELAKYLNKICGKEPKRIKSSQDIPEAAIVIGEACPEAVRAEAKKLGKDGFIIRTQGQKIFICGGGRQGTLYGIYAFLEDVLGCRWWAHDAEFVPSKQEIKIGKLDIRSASPFIMHDLYNLEAQTRKNNMLWKTRSKSTFQPTGNHTFHALLASYAEKKPEYWPYAETKDKKTGEITFQGKNIAKNGVDFNIRVLHFNYLAPGMPEDLAEAFEKEILKRNGDLEDNLYFAGQGDWYGGLDQSPESLAVYEAEAWTDPDGVKHRAMSAPLVRLMNKTGEILAKKYPGVKVGTFAYMSTDSPPGITKPADNVYIWLPRLRYGITLSIEEAAGDVKVNESLADIEEGERVATTEAEAEAAEAVKAAAEKKDPVKAAAAAARMAEFLEKKESAERANLEKAVIRSRQIKQSIERWNEIAPGRLLIWDYGTNYANYLLPTPNLRAMSQNIKYYHRIGVRGVMIQGNYTSYGGDLCLLKNYVWRKLLWNPELDTEALIKEFCEGYYGPASADILDYVNILENSPRTPKKIIADEFNGGAPYLTPDVVSGMKEALKKAVSKVQGEENKEYLARVNEASASLEARELWKQGPLVEKDGRLIRSSIEKEKGGSDTSERAAVLAKSSRGSGVTEMSCPLIQTRRMLSWNGGPLYVLKGGNLTAKIAPSQGTEHLWQLLCGDKIALEKSMVAPGSDLFDVVGTGSGKEIQLKGETGYGSWDIAQDHFQKETIVCGPDSVLRWSGTLLRTNKTDGEIVAPRVESQYAVSDPKKIRVEYNDGTGWKPLEIAEFARRGRPLRGEELKGAEPEKYIVEMAPMPKFELRVSREDTKVQVLDTIVSPRVVAVCAVWIPKLKVVKTYVWCEKVGGFEVGKESPLFIREISVREL